MGDRYIGQMAQYIPPPGHDAKGYLLHGHQAKKRYKKAIKDPNAPKRSSGAYVFFTNEMRPIITQQFPSLKFVEMGRMLGERWRAITPEEKKKFEAIAAKDKIRFQMEMQQYTANQLVQQQQNAVLQAQSQALHQQEQQQQLQQQQQQQQQQQLQLQQQQLQHLPSVEQHHYLPTTTTPGINTTAAQQHNHYGLDPQQYQNYDVYGQPQDAQ